MELQPSDRSQNQQEVHRGRTDGHMCCGSLIGARSDRGLAAPIESHLLQAFVTEPIKPFVDHVISFGAELFFYFAVW